MPHYPANTLSAGRLLIMNKIEELRHLTRSDDPLAWDQARIFTMEIVEACKVVHLELAHYTHQLQAIQVATPEEDEAMDELEVHASHVHSHFAPMIDALKGTA